MPQIVINTDLSKQGTTITLDGKELRGTITSVTLRMNNHTKGVKMVVKSPVIKVRKTADGSTRTSTPSEEFDLSDADSVQALLENQDFWDKNTVMEEDAPEKPKKKSKGKKKKSSTKASNESADEAVEEDEDEDDEDETPDDVEDDAEDDEDAEDEEDDDDSDEEDDEEEKE